MIKYEQKWLIVGGRTGDEIVHITECGPKIVSKPAFGML